MSSSETGLQLDATIERVGGQLRLTGTTTTGEGTREPLDYPVDSLRFFNDSLSFVFAPLGIGVTGRCLENGTIVGRFEHPQTAPFGPIIGEGTIQRL